ncbi:hypothetical protein PG994_008116 [Apiospora phragmitis]|uniref:Uncharacterized protein n=1 Tax=Apiospora phragmitis TaxID=2905665 RepID=A0ABR1US50_9PEZI
MSMPPEPMFALWATAQKHVYQPPSDEQMTAFRDLFSNTSPSAVEVSEISSRIAKPCIKPWRESPIQGLWSVIQNAVDELSSQNDKLVALLLAMQRLPDGKGVQGPGPWFVDLPLFDNHWSEWVDMSCIELFLEQRQRGGVSLRRALERTPWDQSSPTCQPPPCPIAGGFTDSEDDSDDTGNEDGGNQGDEIDEKEEDREDPNSRITVLDVLVPAAAQWIQYFPREIYEKAAAGGEMDSEYDHNGTNFGTKKG